MSISVVLRLAPAAVAARQLAGEAEVVATGQRALITNADDLLAFVAATTDDAPAAAPPAPDAVHATPLETNHG